MKGQLAMKIEYSKGNRTSKELILLNRQQFEATSGRKMKVMLIFPPIPMPARVFVFVYAAIELYLGVTGTQAGVAHFAHLGGMLGGYLMLRRWRRRRSD